MLILLEYKKIKRTGLVPAFLISSLLGGLVPILNMAARSENYVGLADPPLQILLDANWKMMSMLNILLVICGACIMYHTEYADNAIQRMKTLPCMESTMFFGKFMVMLGLSFVVFTVEAVAMAYSSLHWFNESKNLWNELLKNFGYSMLLLLPVVLLSLVISSSCKNMWVSLGIGVLCVSAATMIVGRNFFLSLFPFALPFQIYAGTSPDQVMQYIIASIIEVIIIIFAELIYLKVRGAVE